MTKFLVVFDVDSTLIDDEAIELLAQHAGTFEQVAAVTERAMRGELDFAESLIERVATLAGLDANVLDQVASALSPTKGARELIAAIHERGGKAAVAAAMPKTAAATPASVATAAAPAGTSTLVAQADPAKPS